MLNTKKPIERINFSKIKKVIDIPDLIEVQKQSYAEFLQQDVPEDKRKFQGKPDRCFYIKYYYNGKQYNKRIGWLSEGYTAQLVANIKADKIIDFFIIKCFLNCDVLHAKSLEMFLCVPCLTF